MNRYHRQMIVPMVGADGQSRLEQAHVLVVGAGGLGCPVLQYLVGAGVGWITVIDPDHVEESNLHRQPLFRMSDLGQAKVRAAHDHLTSYNPNTKISAVYDALTPANALQMVDGVDVVVDAADSFAVSYILSDICRAQKTPLVSASALGQTGYIGGFCGHDAPSLRAVFPDLPHSNETCASVGVLGPVVGVIGAMQAQVTLHALLQRRPSPLGQMITLDLQSMRFGGFDFRTAPEPETRFPFMARADICPTDLVIELRGKDEAPKPIVPSAMRLTLNKIISFQPDCDQRVVLCCASGLRAWRAAQDLQSRGYRRLALLAARAAG